jgi:putative PIN family toxin of toxin-antitoxin system
LPIAFDASTIVGAALKQNSIPMRALLAARERDVIALSEPVFAEIEEVLARPKFAIALSAERREEILELIAAAAFWVEPNMAVADCVDPKDNKYLELALASGAGIIVSSDHHLLNLHPWRGVRIVNAADYLARAEGLP